MRIQGLLMAGLVVLAVIWLVNHFAIGGGVAALGVDTSAAKK